MDGFEWVMDLKDGMTAPSAAMNSALKSVKAEMSATEAEMRKLQATQLMYKQAGFGQGAKAVGEDLAKLRLQLGETRASYKELKDVQDEANKGGESSIFAEVFGAVTLEKALEKVIDVEKEAIKFMAELVVEGGKMALEANELRTHMAEMFSGLGGGDKAGEAMYASIQKLRKVVPESEKEISSWTATLMAAGMTDPKRVESSIKAMASASALMGGGDTGGSASQKVQNLTAKSLESGQFKGNAKALVGTGVSADELATQLGMTPANFRIAFQKGRIEASKGIDALNDVLQRKGSVALEGAMGELPVMIAKGKEAFAHMFDGVNVKPFTDAVREFISVLDTSKPSGRAMKLTITAAFSDIMKVSGEATRALTLGFLYVELGILKLMHVFAPSILQMREWNKSGATLAFMKTSLVGMAAALGVAVAIAYVAIKPFLLIYDAVTSIVDGLMTVIDKISQVKSFNPFGGGGDDVPGPQQSGGYAGGGGSDWDAPTSPAHATGGMVGKPAPGEFWASVAPGETIVPKGGMAALPAAGGAQSSGGAGSGVVVHIDGIEIRIDGAGKHSEEIVGMLESSLADIFERVGQEVGA